MEWILSLFFSGYGKRPRTSFVNTCIKQNLGLLLNTEISLNMKMRLRVMSPFIGQNPKLFFMHVLTKDVLRL